MMDYGWIARETKILFFNPSLFIVLQLLIHTNMKSTSRTGRSQSSLEDHLNMKAHQMVYQLTDWLIFSSLLLRFEHVSIVFITSVYFGLMFDLDLDLLWNISFAKIWITINNLLCNVTGIEIANIKPNDHGNDTKLKWKQYINYCA